TPEGAAAAKVCAINLLAQVKAACGGDLDRLKRVVKLGAFVNSTPDFIEQPQVVNGASDFLGEVGSSQLPAALLSHSILKSVALKSPKLFGSQRLPQLQAGCSVS
ncbi:MAG: RidA family protein, partial [Rhodobacteraceae bacterium]|nr:RidA family protein [Paracoccaceae bacterium]